MLEAAWEAIQVAVPVGLVIWAISFITHQWSMREHKRNLRRHRRQQALDGNAEGAQLE